MSMTMWLYCSSIGVLLYIYALVLVVSVDCGSGDVTCGDRCYVPTTHVCAAPGFLCPLGFPLRCGDACYNSRQYSCNNGVLQQVIPPTTPPANTPSACPPADLSCGGRCFSPLSHVCVVASNMLCPTTAPLQCGRTDACYSHSQYSCINELLRTPPAPAPAAVLASYSDIGTTANTIVVKWWQWSTNSPVVSTSDPTTARPAALLATGNIDCSGYVVQTGFTKPVLFLSGVLLPSPTPVTRTCIGTIPLGTYIYFPIFTGETDRPNPIPANNPLNIPFLTCLSSQDPNGFREQYMLVTVDGTPVPHLIETYAFSQPELFTVQSLTPPLLKIGSSLFPGPRWIQAAGYQVLLAPLPAGQHTIRIQVDAPGVCGTPPGIFKIDVQYTFVVA